MAVQLHGNIPRFWIEYTGISYHRSIDLSFGEGISRGGGCIRAGMLEQDCPCEMACRNLTTTVLNGGRFIDILYGG
jgi:hypothetical protein